MFDRDNNKMGWEVSRAMVIPKLQTSSDKMKEISTLHTILSLHPVFLFHYSESGMLSETSSSPQLMEFKNACSVS